MLGVTQGILKSPETDFKNSNIGRMVSFDEIFDQIRTEISSGILRDINGVSTKVKENSTVATKTIKTLFLLQQLEWIPISLTNISRAMLNSINIDITCLESDVKSALNELIKAKYVIFENDHYEYISGSKKLIEEAISAESVKRHEIKRFAIEQLENVLDFNRLNYENVKYFDIKVLGDDNELSSRGNIKLKVYSPIFMEYKNVEKAAIIDESHGPIDTVFWLSNPDITIDNDISKYLRTKKVIDRRDRDEKKSSEEIAILQEKRESLESLRQGIESSIKNALLSGNIIYDGTDEVLTGKSEKVETVFEREVTKVVPFIYTKFDDAKFKVNEKSIKSILSATSGLNRIEKDLDLFDENEHINLHGKILDEVYNKIKTSNDRGDILSGADILNYFDNVPYGWNVILVRITVAALFRSASIYLKYNGKEYYDYKKQEAQEFLINSNKFKKTTLWIEETVQIEPEERENIQQNLNVIFNVKSDDTINSLSKNVDKQLAEMVSEYERQKIFWEENGYVIKPVFYIIRETCDKVLYEANPAKKLKKFLELADETKEQNQYINQIKDFKNREDKKLLSSIKKLPYEINVSSQSIDSKILEEYRNYINEINTVISNKEIVEKWPVILENYNKAVEKTRYVYDMLHLERYNVYSRMINEIKNDSILAANIKENSFDSINSYLCFENLWVDDDLRCKKCQNTIYELDNNILAKDIIRQKIELKLTPENSKEKRTRVNLKSSSGMTVIHNDADLKRALSNIEKKVKIHLDKGETVILQ